MNSQNHNFFPSSYGTATTSGGWYIDDRQHEGTTSDMYNTGEQVHDHEGFYHVSGLTPYYGPSPEYGVPDFSAQQEFAIPQPSAFATWSGLDQSESGPLYSDLVEPGCYYPDPLNPMFLPQVYGAAITGLCFDSSFAAMYVASVTQSINSRNSLHRNLQDRAAILATHVPTDGSLYSSVVAHPEAPANVLNKIYTAIYGESSTPDNHIPSSSRRSIPNHAYRPPYGTNAPILSEAMSTKGNHQLGINSLVPLSGYVASVSPAGVRIHASGGLQVADLDVEGMLCGVAHPNEGTSCTHITVGGLSVIADPERRSRHAVSSPLMCLDVYQELKVVSRGAIDVSSTNKGHSVSVTSIAASESRGSLLVGCNDGCVRLYDSRLRFLAKVKSHAGGVVDIAVSADGNQVATTGFSALVPRASATPLYAFPDTTILLYDMRYLGRGGFPHSFTGMQGGPRHLTFIPNCTPDGPLSRLLVASGQAGGGLQILTPFEEHASNAANNFVLPPLERSEAISSMMASEDKLALGTTQGRILFYEATQYGQNQSRSSTAGTPLPQKLNFQLGSSSTLQVAGQQPKLAKEPLQVPPFQPSIPALRLDPSLLLREQPMTHSETKNGSKSIFSRYIYSAALPPSISRVADVSESLQGVSIFGPLETEPMIATSKLEIASNLVKNATNTLDYLQTIHTSALSINVFDDHRPEKVVASRGQMSVTLPNPNKFLYCNKLFSVAYATNLNRMKIRRSGSQSQKREHYLIHGEENKVAIPERYRLTIRPSHKSVSSALHKEFNATGFLPGWDYPPTMPNAFAPPILILLYFIPEVYRTAWHTSIFDRQVNDKSILPELAILFHRIESISRYGIMYSTESGSLTHIGVWAPLSFLSCLSTMPEAEQLQVLDGSPEAIPTPRRTEAFFRFLLYQLDKEAARTSSSRKTLDSICGISFLSVNEFISGLGAPSKSMTRAMTLDLQYDPFIIADVERKKKVDFVELLHYNLCRVTRLRAWNQQSKSYETIVQRKIVTSLPTMLTLSCACAGRKAEEGLCTWRELTGLPEIIEIELKDDRVVVKGLALNNDGNEKHWQEYEGSESFPTLVEGLVRECRVEGNVVKRQYQLDAVIFYVRDDLDRHCSEEMKRSDCEYFGHHAIHLRVSKAVEKHFLEEQLREIQAHMNCDTIENVSCMTKLGMFSDRALLEKRISCLTERLAASDSGTASTWFLMNGLVVTESAIAEVASFKEKFKEPSLIIFRAVDHVSEHQSLELEYSKLPCKVITTRSITNGALSPYYENQKPSQLPGKGDLVAFDAEFVSVQEEESVISETGTKITIRETRHALGRVSVVNCRTKRIIFDDHVLPREPVVDHLTRFSGIVSKDLDPSKSPHHLISSWAAYLKLRYMMESGCIFVGHGLQQDFWTLNLTVPDSQIIDTVDIYHKPAQRYISLRFLTNFVLGRDMQQDTHDSVEDALAAFELYKRAVELKKVGKFEKLLDELYAYGQRTDWKLGIEGSDSHS